MAKVLVVYASMTGNTEEMAEAIVDGLKESGAEIVLKSVLDANASEMAHYDGILLGAYTWGDGELPDEFLDFYEEMDEVSLEGRKAAAFGSADSSYPLFGAAVDILTAKLKQIGAEIAMEGLKIELCPSEDEKEHCRAYGRKFAEKLA
ncbi:flavodoxin [Paenibacillus thermoaerophilus]|uniref:Flavodoxin n=1 Tax=Paenibacillus thermoaerophilus TaxID=1215385 RepID=A0ABW2UYY3_9BACL|nr:flavodoxin [Paenibacillus thermoaerophilus]TMV16001.1 flavodoxin [Paenibacillus thermoaerophilus]